MTAVGGKDARDVLPRWRSFGATVRSGETLPLGALRPQGHPADLSELEEAFDKAPGVHTASDLVGAALAADAAEVGVAVSAAHHILKSTDAPRAASNLAEFLLIRPDIAAARPVAPEPALDFDGFKIR